MGSIHVRGDVRNQEEKAREIEWERNKLYIHLAARNNPGTFHWSLYLTEESPGEMASSHSLILKREAQSHKRSKPQARKLKRSESERRETPDTAATKAATRPRRGKAPRVSTTKKTIGDTRKPKPCTGKIRDRTRPQTTSKMPRPETRTRPASTRTTPTPRPAHPHPHPRCSRPWKSAPTSKTCGR